MKIYQDYNFLAQDKTNVDLAREANVSEFTIRNWRKKLNVGNDDALTEQLVTKEMASRGRRLQNTQDRLTATRREIREAVRYENRVQGIIDSLISEIKDGVKPENVSKIQTKKKDIKSEDVFIADIYMGKSSRGTIGSRDYSKDVAFDRIRQIANELISRETSHYNLFIMGDLVECIVAIGMHNGQMEDCELSPFEQIVQAEVVISSLIRTLIDNKKTIKIYGIGGNHDRTSRDKTEDSSRLGALIIFQMLKTRWANIDIHFEEGENIQCIVSNGIGYIIHHGDERGLTPDRLFDLYSKHDTFREWHVKNPYKYLHLVVVQGDKHHTEVIDSSKGTFVIVPAIVGGEGYAQKKLSLSSPSGYMISGNKDVENTSFYNEIIRLY